MSPGPPPPLRPAVDADGVGLAALIAACFAEYEGCVFDRREFPELDAIATHFAQAGGRLWIAEDDGRVVGSLGARPAAADRIELLKVYVAAERRGSGLAATLLSAALDFAREQGAAAIELWSDTRFTRAHAFYEKHGFRRTGERRFLADLSDTREDRFVRPL